VTLPVWTRLHLTGWGAVAGGGLLAVFHVVPQVAAAIAAIGFGTVVVSVTIVRDAERGARAERSAGEQSAQAVEPEVVDVEPVERAGRARQLQDGGES
jgi:hypothetical protein